MRRRTNKNGGGIKNIPAAGLVPLLLLASVPGCAVRDLSDWSNVQAVAPSAETEVQLYKDESRKESPYEENRKHKGLFHLATDDSLLLTTGFQEADTFRKRDIEKVWTYRPVEQRRPDFIALGASLAATTILAMGASSDISAGGVFFLFGTIALPITTVAFLTSRMEKIYHVPAKDRDTSWSDVAPTVEPKKANPSK